MRVLEVARKRGHGSPEVERQWLVKSRGRKSSDDWAGRPRHTWPALPFASRGIPLPCASQIDSWSRVLALWLCGYSDPEGV